MISFKAFVEGINNAIIAANDYLMDKHEGLLDNYFEKTVEINKDAGHEDHTTLRPKSVCLQYPSQTADGSIAMVDVDVPLITLVPIQFSKIDKVKVTAQFDLQVMNDELQIIFTGDTQKKKWNLFGKSKTQSKSSGQIEITIRPSETPEGIQKMIEGYDKVLRAQIPH